jgi:excisionase family DNA binding protein
MEHTHLVTVGEAARIRRVSADTIRRWAKTGRLRVACLVGKGQRLFNDGIGWVLEHIGELLKGFSV